MVAHGAHSQRNGGAGLLPFVVRGGFHSLPLFRSCFVSLHSEASGETQEVLGVLKYVSRGAESFRFRFVLKHAKTKRKTKNMQPFRFKTCFVFKTRFVLKRRFGRAL